MWHTPTMQTHTNTNTSRSRLFQAAQQGRKKTEMSPDIAGVSVVNNTNTSTKKTESLCGEKLWSDLSVWPLSSSVSSSTTVDWFLTDVKAIFMNSPVDVMTFFQLFFNIQTIEDLVEITLIWICSVWICHSLLSCPICFCFTLQWCRNAVVTSRVWLFKFYKKISRQNSLC